MPKKILQWLMLKKIHTIIPSVAWKTHYRNIGLNIIKTLRLPPIICGLIKETTWIILEVLSSYDFKLNNYNY